MKNSTLEVGHGGELHHVTTVPSHALTTNQGVAITDNQDSLKAAVRGPVLLEDFILREKITHFDHERIAERVVHARGYGAHGYFQCYRSFSDLTAAQFLHTSEQRTPVFVRFSTVAGSAGSPDTARDVRGMAVKFYTQEGNFDLVGNNIPVFFIQDAMKFPDLVHSVKPEPDRGFPQAQSAHDTFWDFVSLIPESSHMLLWIMSDRSLPRSFRTMPGFGVHTFQLVNKEGAATLVKFHWRPKLGTRCLVWDEAVRISGADPDYHRRDLWNAIEAEDFPEWEFSFQLFDQEQADDWGIDPLDPTKLVPEELAPLVPVGKLVLDRNVDNFFAETEQVAFCPANLVPGIHLTNDPLLQGRLFSYLDTQISRLGGANFHNLPINSAKCPIRNFMRDGQFQSQVQSGRIAYEPNSLSQTGPYESKTGFRTPPANIRGTSTRARSETFKDHYTQAQQFFQSQTTVERKHIVEAFAFELGKCQELQIRERVVELLSKVSSELGSAVAERLNLSGAGETSEQGMAPTHQSESFAGSTTCYDSLSVLKNQRESLAGHNIGVLTSHLSDEKVIADLLKLLKSEGASYTIVLPQPASNCALPAKLVDPTALQFLDGAPSCLFDSVVIAIAPAELDRTGKRSIAIDWIRTAFAHLKVIGVSAESRSLVEQAGIEQDDGVVFADRTGFSNYVKRAKLQRMWERQIP